MKNLNTLRFAAAFSLLLFLFSCSKDSLQKEQSNGRNNLTGQKSMKQAEEPGTVHAMISQQNLSVVMMVYNRFYSPEPVFADELGNLDMSDLPTGVYTVQFSVVAFDPAPRDYHDITIDNVIVKPGEATDLGVITFQ